MGEEFAGWVLSLGRLGIVVDLTIDVVDAFQVAQTVVDDLPDQIIASELGSILRSAYSVSVFTDWGSPARASIWLKERRSAAGHEPARRQVWGGRLADGPRNPVPGMPAQNATPQMGVPGAWNERLPHFRREFMPSSGDELQSEHLLPIDLACAAWQELSEIRHLIQPPCSRSERCAPWAQIRSGSARPEGSTLSPSTSPG
jgi:xylitol oxidase